MEIKKEKLQKLVKNWYRKLSHEEKLRKRNTEEIDIGTYLKKTNKKQKSIQKINEKKL